MKKNLMCAFLLLASSCWGQNSYTLPLLKENSALSLPAMTAGRGVLYEAHRSFDLLRFSNQLQISVFDLTTHRELKHTAISIPRVHGARAADGFFLSPDGQMLMYAEIYEPKVLLVLSAKDLSEVRRTDFLPFTSDDRERFFAGFDDDGLLSFSSSRMDRLRFIRMNLSDFKIASDLMGPEQENAIGGYAWSPTQRKVWIPSSLNVWREFTEDGHSSEDGFRSQSKYSSVGHGATLFDGANLVAFVGNLSDAGSIASYKNHHLSELAVACVPEPYGSSIGDYVGAICTTSPDREPEHGGNKILTSQFMLLKADGPKIVWRIPMPFMVVADTNNPDTGVQKGNPLLYPVGSNLLVIAPSKSSELIVYEISLERSGAPPNVTSRRNISLD